MAVPTIVFDLDGTLVDTAPDLVETLNVVFTREGLAPLPYDTARNLVGGGVKAMIANGIEAEGSVLAPAKLEQMFTDFIGHYSDHIADRSRPFPGLREALDTLGAHGHRLAVCTNKLERLSVRLLDQFKLADRFAAICGRDTFGIQKPDPEILRRRRRGHDATRHHDWRFHYRYSHRTRGRCPGHRGRLWLQRAPDCRIWARQDHQSFCPVAGVNCRHFVCNLTGMVRNGG
jgi:phosphoglycolate phosphatase-like HAD superfamily hydrolase